MAATERAVPACRVPASVTPRCWGTSLSRAKRRQAATISSGSLLLRLTATSCEAHRSQDLQLVQGALDQGAGGILLHRSS